ncbi:orotidine-5'-phosphate decarboxylase [Fulvivirga sp. M361]|uniref:orotidine-5'-phosphate decarboxylase n=1 Tax=Fulvivirga sp. M361 TaxID=2594266 RepID=UPI001179E7BE|nr:orotidine-5'-phosphate decarboxylase [Fulvivirga sp. M361]TRX47990.1 orotidine-5'-phosphate decarboxylase [Fulvivirga sp. M361]
MTQSQLFDKIRQKDSYLCVGLDTDMDRIPKSLLKEKDPVFEFNRQIIDATVDYCVAYKPNIAFYEALGPKGWESLAKTLDYIPKEVFTIADAKRGDIGNTSKLYAKAFFETMDFDSITVAPYMGADSVTPFLEFDGKWVILLAHTSNQGSQDFQLIKNGDSQLPLYAEVIKKSQLWCSSEQLMYVVGATRADRMAEIRNLAPDHFFLVPGVGAQGGDLKAVSQHGMNKTCGLLVNNTRSIIYASSEKDFAAAAGREAHKMQQDMQRYLDEYLPR